MIRFQHWAWSKLLRAAPTCALQDAIVGRDGVRARFIGVGQSETVTVNGVCWLTINED